MYGSTNLHASKTDYVIKSRRVCINLNLAPCIDHSRSIYIGGWIAGESHSYSHSLSSCVWPDNIGKEIRKYNFFIFLQLCQCIVHCGDSNRKKGTHLLIGVRRWSASIEESILGGNNGGG